MSRKAKHRGNPRKSWPLGIRIYAAKNKWYYFVKPALKLKALRLANKVLAFITRWP